MDNITRPPHYNRKVDVYDFAYHNDLGGLETNIVKYVSRAGKKIYPEQSAKQSRLSDLKKAKETLDRLIAYLEII